MALSTAIPDFVLSDKQTEKRHADAETPEQKAHVVSQQSSKSSWWPLPGTVHGSFLDVGVWTPALEVWFQNNLDAIQRGERTVKTQSQWRTTLRGKREIVRMAESNVHFAEKYFEISS